MRINSRTLQARRRNQRFNRSKQKKIQAKLVFQRRRVLLRAYWLQIRRRVDRWLSKAHDENPPDLQQPLYVVKDREIRERETRLSGR
ncbi:MAG: hypothetical protein ACI4NJ_03100 [Cellvibrio sp.]